MIAAATLLCGMAVSSAKAAPVIIDDFTTGIFQGVSGLALAGLGFAAGQQNGSMLGGQRDVYLRVTSQVAGQPDASAQVQSGTGYFEYLNRIGAQSNFLIQWDGSDAQTVGGAHYFNPMAELNHGLTGTGANFGGVDLTGGGMFDAFGTLFTLDGNTVESFVMLFSGAGNVSRHDFNKTGPAASFQHYALFQNSGAPDAFSIVSGTGADFTDITAIVIGGRAPSGTGFGLNLHLELISSIAVPEPTTIALLGLGLMGLAVMRRRRSTAA